MDRLLDQAGDDWRAIQETLYLLAAPGMRASIQRGLKTPVADGSVTLDWGGAQAPRRLKPAPLME